MFTSKYDHPRNLRHATDNEVTVLPDVPDEYRICTMIQPPVSCTIDNCKCTIIAIPKELSTRHSIFSFNFLTFLSVCWADHDLHRYTSRSIFHVGVTSRKHVHREQLRRAMHTSFLSSDFQARGRGRAHVKLRLGLGLGLELGLHYLGDIKTRELVSKPPIARLFIHLSFLKDSSNN